MYTWETTPDVFTCIHTILYTLRCEPASVSIISHVWHLRREMENRENYSIHLPAFTRTHTREQYSFFLENPSFQVFHIFLVYIYIYIFNEIHRSITYIHHFHPTIVSTLAKSNLPLFRIIHHIDPFITLWFLVSLNTVAFINNDLTIMINYISQNRSHVY